MFTKYENEKTTLSLYVEWWGDGYTLVNVYDWYYRVWDVVQLRLNCRNSVCEILFY